MDHDNRDEGTWTATTEMEGHGPLQRWRDLNHSRDEGTRTTTDEGHGLQRQRWRDLNRNRDERTWTTTTEMKRPGPRQQR
ncbi:hypothetical protein RRG08_008456 [Elysia crispata]|uniref:Uncharacterized protein n=1 Tax=Elysia crispata TaxID=231223 RepID=A0AAE1E883_9GAST|nr:hypothetical protein RRG08_008456 [Elysia crispata]